MKKNKLKTNLKYNGKFQMNKNLKINKQNNIHKLVLDRLKTSTVSFKKFQRKKYKKQKRYSIIYKTLKIFNKFYEKNGDPECRRKWRIRKPFFLMSFYFRRYIKRYYGRLRNNKMNLVYNLTKKNIKKKGFFFLRYFEKVESILPIFLTRLGLFRNPMVAKDFIKRGYIYINNKRLTNFNYILKPNDLIGIDTSVIKIARHRIFVDNKLKLYAYFYRKMKVPRRFKYKWYGQAKNFRNFLFLKKSYNLLSNILKQYFRYLKGKNLTQDKLFIKLFVNFILDKVFLNNIVYLKYKRKLNLIKLKRKLIYRIKRFRNRKNGRFARRTFRPYNKLMAAGFPYLFRIKSNRFMLNVEYSRKINKFIYIKPPVWENLNMYLLNSHTSLRARYSNTIYKDMFTFFLDNHKKSIL